MNANVAGSSVTSWQASQGSIIAMPYTVTLSCQDQQPELSIVYDINVYASISATISGS